MIKRGKIIVDTLDSIAKEAVGAKDKQRELLKKFKTEFERPKRKRLIFDKANKPIGVEDY